jgi:hypothetical protein
MCRGNFVSTLRAGLCLALDVACKEFVDSGLLASIAGLLCATFDLKKEVRNIRGIRGSLKLIEEGRLQ